MNILILNDLKSFAKKNEDSNKKLYAKLKKKKPNDLDKNVHQLHDDFFNNFDCLECANCCKSLGPRINQTDVSRMASHLKMKTSDFINKYIKIDEEQDYIFNTSPCPFLMTDNYCSIYESRPKACKDYPHTDRNKFFQITDITLKNTYTCPAVYSITEQLKKIY